MDTVLWVLQWVLAVVFLMAGAMKAFLPPDKLLANPNMGWVADAGIQRARMAGFSEMVGAVGLILPGITNLPDFLTLVALAGLLAIMILAALTVHKPRGESMVPNLVLGLVVLLVFVGRLIEPLA